MGNFKNLTYAILSAILLSIPWLFEFTGCLLFIGFVPLLLLENQLANHYNKSNRFQFLNYTFGAFFLWNLLSAWWLGYATMVGLLLFLFLNTFLMSTIWYLYHRFKMHTNENLALLFLIALWLSFEYLHLNWDIQLPGMTIGGAFGNQVTIVQWYEYTGVLGGSLWVLAANIVIYKLVKQILYFRKYTFSTVFSVCAVLLLPMVFSIYQYVSYSEKGDTINVQVLQPNIDPFTEKFDPTTSNKQLNILLSLIDTTPTNNASLIIGPETALASMWEDSLCYSPEIQKLKARTQTSTDQNIIIGANTKKFLPENSKPTITTRYLADGRSYEEYNSAIRIDSAGASQIYHKNILVSGVEKVPFARYFGSFKNFIVDLGGTTGGLGVGSPQNFRLTDSLQISPAICFESMFGEYIGGLVKSGGEIIVVMTNDGWWKKSSGAGLHFSYSRLRAIELRRSIARSANTGYSGFINQRGDVLAKTDWWKQTAITGQLHRNQKITFYAQYGDYLGRISAFVAAMLLLLFLSGRLNKEKPKNDKNVLESGDNTRRLNDKARVRSLRSPKNIK